MHLGVLSSGAAFVEIHSKYQVEHVFFIICAGDLPVDTVKQTPLSDACFQCCHSNSAFCCVLPLLQGRCQKGFVCC